MIFITIGCIEAEKVLFKWHKIFKKSFPNYDRTILIYLEGRFALATKKTPLCNLLYDTDLLKNYKLGALLTPEFEHAQLDRIIIGLEARIFTASIATCIDSSIPSLAMIGSFL
ncbi:hypothetical protein ES705_45338 [subsurface metagenome]